MLKFLFLSRFDTNNYLSEKEKRAILRQAENLFKGDFILSIIKKTLYREEKERSIMLTTLIIIFKYIALTARCLLSAILFIFSFSSFRIKSPWIELCDQIKEDLTRVIYAAGKMLNMVVSFVFIILFSLFDMIANQFIARFFTLIGFNQVSKGIYRICYKINDIYNFLNSLFHYPVKICRKNHTTFQDLIANQLDMSEIIGLDLQPKKNQGNENQQNNAEKNVSLLQA